MVTYFVLHFEIAQRLTVNQPMPDLNVESARTELWEGDQTSEKQLPIFSFCAKSPQITDNAFRCIYVSYFRFIIACFTLYQI